MESPKEIMDFSIYQTANCEKILFVDSSSILHFLDMGDCCERSSLIHATFSLTCFHVQWWPCGGRADEKRRNSKLHGAFLLVADLNQFALSVELWKSKEWWWHYYMKIWWSYHTNPVANQQDRNRWTHQFGSIFSSGSKQGSSDASGMLDLF